MGKEPCCKNDGLKKGPWTPEEDKKLLDFIEQHGPCSWRALPAKAGLQRCGKSCRLRWRNYLRPDIKRGKFSGQEEQTIIQLHALVGNRWSAIATLLPKRTDNEIKNYWNTHLKKRLIRMGIDPATHKPKSNALGSGKSSDIADLNHIAQWESARVEAEARLGRDSKLPASNPDHLPITSAPQLLSKAAGPLPLSKQPIIPLCPDIFKAREGEWTNPNAFLYSNVVNLESPTSSLHFPDSMFTVPSIGFGENSFFRTIDNVESLKPQDVLITKEKANDKMEGMLLQEAESFPVDVASIADSLGDPSFLEGIIGDPRWDDAEVFNITGLYDNNLSSIFRGNLEENMKYWNTIH